MHASILDETIARVIEILGTDILGAELTTITIERAVIGLFFTGVKLSTGEAGACATPREAVPEGVCCPLSAGKAAFRSLSGLPAAELMGDARQPEGLRRAVGIATLNALAERCWQRRPHPDMVLRPATDAFDATGLRGDEQVVLGRYGGINENFVLVDGRGQGEAERAHEPVDGLREALIEAIES